MRYKFDQMWWIFSKLNFISSIIIYVIKLGFMSRLLTNLNDKTQQRLSDKNSTETHTQPGTNIQYFFEIILIQRICSTFYYSF